jgi:flagellar basal-body rod protein FlgC
MPPADPLSISASALAVQRTRINVIAENIANAQTTRTASGGPYRRRVVTVAPEGGFAALVAGPAEPRGVRVAGIVEVGGTRRSYTPGHPEADREGYVELPDVNPVSEMTELMAATRAYEASVAAIQAAKSMAQRALEIGR